MTRHRVVQQRLDAHVAALAIRYPGDDDPLVAALAEVLVGELVAQSWFAASGEGLPA